MALKPLHDRVLVRRVESEEKTAGGLIITDSAKEKPAEGDDNNTGDTIDSTAEKVETKQVATLHRDALRIRPTNRQAL